MPGDSRPWKPKAWEQYVQRLLKRHYASPPGTYQEVPDTVKGDGGIEGFAADRHRVPVLRSSRMEYRPHLFLKHQKNKITEDIGKFIKNKAPCEKLFGTIKIGHWNFVVPYWNDKELKKHANDKADLVRSKGLRHVGTNFLISILTAKVSKLKHNYWLT